MVAKLLIQVLSALLMLSILTPFRFDLQSDSSKCIFEDIKINAVVVGKYFIVDPAENQPLPDSHKVSVQVTSPYGRMQQTLVMELAGNQTNLTFPTRGTEHEKFGFEIGSLRPMKYEQISDFLNVLAERFDWAKIMEGDYVIGLK